MEHVARKYWTEERGNATVDRLILGAGIVSLSLALMAALVPPHDRVAEATPDAPLSQDA